MRSRFFLPFFIILAVLGLSTASAFAADPDVLGKFGFWTAYSLTENKQVVCYMSIMARSPQPQKSKRGDVVLMITHNQTESTTDVVSYTAGMKFKPGSEVIIDVGGKQFNLFTQSDTAWSRDAATDHALTAALRNGATASVTGMAANGKKIADTVNLKGGLAAYKAISKACNVPFKEPAKSKTSAKTPTRTLAKTPAKTTPKKVDKSPE